MERVRGASEENHSRVDFPWTTWWQDDLPCQFSKNATSANSRYLIDFLGERLLKGIACPGANHHPLFHLWLSNGATSYLEINGLAEDLRMVDSVSGVENVICDLLNAERYSSARHVLHSAAMFARADGNKVDKFFTQTSKKVPDFSLTSSGKPILVEAKLLTKSEKEENFERWAKQLQEQIFKKVLPLDGFKPIPVIVMKDVDNLPDPKTILEAVGRGLERFSGTTIAYHSALFNILIEPPGLPREGLTGYRYCIVLCSRSPNEDIRVQDRSKHASKQLAAVSGGQRPGLLCLGISPIQAPHTISNLLAKRFADGQYSNISGVMLMFSGTHLAAPKRSTLDLIALVKNEQAKMSLPDGLRVNCMGLLSDFSTYAPSKDDISAYRCMACEGQSSGEGAPKLLLPDIRKLSPEMLA